jgi:S1-C subfamily serine protease
MHGLEVGLPRLGPERSDKGDSMKRTLWFLIMGLQGVIGTVWAAQGVAQTATAQSGGDFFHKAEPSMVLLLVGAGDGRVQSVSTGVIIRSDGIVLTAYHPLKGAQEVQVRLRDGEIYDQVDLMGFDERRDVAALHFTASGLAALSCAGLEEAVTGDRIHVLDADGTMTWSSSDGILGPVRLADEVLGAGHGYRVIQFMAPVPPGALGGALVNVRGQLLGIITAALNSGGQQFAVPAESVAGLADQGLHTRLGTGKNLASPALALNGEAAPEEQSAPALVLARARTLSVTSRTMFFTPFMLEKELLNNANFRELEINVLEGNRGGELLVSVDRPLFTYDFTYSLSDGHSGIVLATGKVTAIDGSHAAQGMARKLAEELARARAEIAAQANRQEAPRAQ